MCPSGEEPQTLSLAGVESQQPNVAPCDPAVEQAAQPQAAVRDGGPLGAQSDELAPGAISPDLPSSDKELAHPAVPELAQTAARAGASEAPGNAGDSAAPGLDGPDSPDGSDGPAGQARARPRQGRAADRRAEERRKLATGSRGLTLNAFFGLRPHGAPVVATPKARCREGPDVLSPEPRKLRRLRRISEGALPPGHIEVYGSPWLQGLRPRLTEDGVDTRAECVVAIALDHASEAVRLGAEHLLHAAFPSNGSQLYITKLLGLRDEGIGKLRSGHKLSRVEPTTDACWILLQYRPLQLEPNLQAIQGLWRTPPGFFGELRVEGKYALFLQSGTKYEIRTNEQGFLTFAGWTADPARSSEKEIMWVKPAPEEGREYTCPWAAVEGQEPPPSLGDGQVVAAGIVRRQCNTSAGPEWLRGGMVLEYVASRRDQGGRARKLVEAALEVCRHEGVPELLSACDLNQVGHAFEGRSISARKAHDQWGFVPIKEKEWEYRRLAQYSKESSVLFMVKQCERQ